MKNCKQCQSSFEITAQDRQFYDRLDPVIGGKKMTMPPPTQCPDCRQQRRLSFRNDRNLYHRKSDLSGKQMVTVYSPDKDFKVYTNEEWWSDQWDPMDYGCDFDFSRPFFEQFRALQRAVPRYSVLTRNCENCDYSPWQVDCKNCYLSTGGRYNEDCYYCFFPTRSENCIDCILPNRSHYCYECIDILASRECFYSIYLENCNECFFCYDLVGSRNCFGCTGLRNKQYWIFNKPYSKEDYERMIKEFSLSDQKHLLLAKKKFEELKLKAPHLDMRLINCEACTGDLIKNSRHALDSYDVEGSEDCRFLYDIRDARDSYDLYIGGFENQLTYEGVSALNATQSAFMTYTWEGCHDVYYTDSCFTSGNLFGCIGLRHKNYCILNKEYTREEYEAVVPRIIEQMRKTGEWGEFFPITLSTFAYNESVAQEYYSLTSAEADKKGWAWHKDIETKSYKGPRIEIPDDIKDVSDDILRQVLTCEVTGRPYKIIPQELKFYRDYGLPVPRRCPDQRHLDRMKLRNPRRLWNRECAECHKAIRTTYAPDRPEIVTCESCYLKAVY